MKIDEVILVSGAQFLGVNVITGSIILTVPSLSNEKPYPYYPISITNLNDDTPVDIF